MGFIGKQPTPVPLVSSDITDGIVTTAKIADTAISTAKIADDAVTGAKIENTPSIANGLTLTDGNLTLASGHGIDFSATANSSEANTVTDTELLEDYEEGHWTPTVEGWTSVTYSYRSASYLKIGHICHVNCSIQFSGTSAGSTVKINGLPFLQELNANNHGSGTGAIGYQTLSTVTNYTVSTVYVVQGTTRLQLYTMGGSAVNASSNASNLWFEFSAVYPTQ